MKPGLRTSIAGLRPISGLLAAVAVARSSVMLYPFYGAYLATERFELSVGQIGLVVGMFGIGALVADVVSGSLAARWPERRIAVVGLAGVAGIVLVIALATEVWTLVALTALWGFCYELVNPIAYTLTARAMPESERRFAFAAVRLAINVGMGIGPVVAGILFKVDPELLPWGTAIGYLAAAFVLARARIVEHAESGSPRTPAGAGDVGVRTRNGARFWSFMAATVPVHFAYALLPTAISMYVIYTLDEPAGWVSAIFAVNAVMVISCEIALNHAMLGLTRRATILIGYACATAGFALMGLGTQETWLLLAATAVWTLGEMIIYPVMPDHISAISPDRVRARNMGFYTANMNLGVVLAPLVFLPLVEVVSPVASWSLVGGLLLAGLLATAALSASRRLWGEDEARPKPEVVESRESADAA